MRVKVLGSAAGGGFPQWNCGCTNCARLRRGVFRGRARSQTQVAISPNGSTWHLLNASPDLRQQLSEYPEFAPPAGTRSTTVSSIVLTSADVDCVLGLLHLREFQPLRIYATASIRRVLCEENTLIRTLARSNPPVRWEDLPLDRQLILSQGGSGGENETLSCRAVSLGGEFPDYVSDHLRERLPKKEAVIGLEVVQGEKRLFYAPSLPGEGDWRSYVEKSDIALLDGTFWTDSELISVQNSGKTATEMGHLPLSGSKGLLEQLKHVQTVRRILIHLNNTNPALDDAGPASRALRDSGWEVAYDGMEFDL
jgi:pyrroloquinoline quinone biosynthesis protein B